MSYLGRVLGGRFKLDSKLGEGGIGEVYKATDLTNGHQVAVKLMTPKAIAEDDDGLMTELFWREMPRAQAAGAGAVGFYGRGKDVDGTIFTVMELIKGQDLDKMRLKSASGRLPVKTVVPVIEQTLETLATAHRSGVVHRDIKPANLLVTPEGKVKIIDFGMADSTRKGIVPSGEFIGTPGFSPPEQVEGKKTTPKSDVWSVGASAYQALSGQPAVDWRRPVPIDCPVPPLQSVAPNVPDHVADAIDGALECDPRNRPTAEEMLEELNPHVHRMMATGNDEPTSLGAKLAIGVAVVGVLYGAYQIATCIREAFAGTSEGKWFLALPSGAWDEEERLAQLDIVALPPGATRQPGDVQISAIEAGTTLMWPPGTVFFKYPPGTLTGEASPRKTASGAGTVIASVFVGLLVAYGVASWKAHQLVDALQAKGIEIVSPESKTPDALADDAVVHSVFIDVFGDAVGSNVLDLAKHHGWCYGVASEAAPPAIKKASGAGADDDTTLYVDLFGNQWLSGPNGVVTGFRPALNVTPGHAYLVGPVRWDGSYDVLADVTLGPPIKNKTAKGPASTIEDTLYVDTTGSQDHASLPGHKGSVPIGTPGSTPLPLVYAWVGNLNADGSFNKLEPAAYLTVNGHKTTGIGKVPDGLTQGHFYKMATDGSSNVGADITPGSH